MRNGMIGIFTLGPLGPVTFDLWGQDGQKAHLQGMAITCAKYEPQGPCSFGDSPDNMKGEEKEKKKEKEKTNQTAQLCFTKHEYLCP